ncbi:MAG: hypothetical protein Fur0037_21900 [Planctomycetota bacterium]
MFGEIARSLGEGTREAIGLAHERLRELLFDRSRPLDHDLAVLALLHDIQHGASPERRLAALQTTAEYLAVETGPNEFGEKIRPVIEKLLRDGDPQSDDPRFLSLAISVASGFADRAAFDLLLDQIEAGLVPDATQRRPVRKEPHVRLALIGICRVWQEMRFARKDMPGPRVIGRWLDLAWRSVEAFRSQEENAGEAFLAATRGSRIENTVNATFFVAAWCRSEHLEKTDLPGLSPSAAEAPRTARSLFEDPPLAPIPAAGEAPADYVRARGSPSLAYRALLDGKTVLFRYERLEPQGGERRDSVQVPCSSPAPKGILARIDFEQSPLVFTGRPEAELSWADATWFDQRELDRVDTFLKLDRPHRSRVVLLCPLPKDASAVAIAIRTKIGARWPLAGHGRARLSVEIPELDFRTERNVVVAENDPTWNFEFSSREFLAGDFGTGTDRFTLVVRLLESNTTCRLRSIEVRARP